jgi:hypothetical protein
MATGDRLQHDHRSDLRCGLEVVIKDQMKTFGSAETALLNLAGLIWLLS